MPQHEITTEGPLLTPEGRIAEPGFSRRPRTRYNPDSIGLTPFPFLNRLRLKEWDFYAVTTGGLTFSTAVAHGGIVGVVFATLIDFPTRALQERGAITALGAHCDLPLTSESGDVRYSRRGVIVEYLLREGRREIFIRWPKFAGDEALAVELVLEEPPSLESITVSTPIGEKRFYFNRKMCGMKATGTLTLGSRREDLGAARALGVLDWGRGVWPYRTFWVWASGAGYLPDGRVLGINLGCGFGDLSAATESCIFVDGRMSKLGHVEIDYDRANVAARPWRFRSEDGRIDLTLAPTLYVMGKHMNALVVRSDLRQITGAFRGHVVTDAGERIALEGDGVVGWAEEHIARW